jgi:hypothetical protein
MLCVKPEFRHCCWAVVVEYQLRRLSWLVLLLWEILVLKSPLPQAKAIPT